MNNERLNLIKKEKKKAKARLDKILNPSNTVEDLVNNRSLKEFMRRDHHGH